MDSPARTSFDALSLHPATQNNLKTLGYTQMTPIQAASLPLALAGSDVIAQAQTGSGKTAAFGLALLERLNPRRFAVQALVLCPTRELADQVALEIRRLARALDNIKVVTLCGGVPLRGQKASLENGAHVVVGTPGRILDHLARATLNVEAINTLVLDEADRMLDMGFLDDITALVQQCPTARQTLLFSATYPDGVEHLAQRFMRDARKVQAEAAGDQPAIEQRFYEVTPAQRLEAVLRVLLHVRPVSTLAFCNTKLQCNALVDFLQARGLSARALHGDLEQRERDLVLAQFANRSLSVLVATDVAARGIDIKELALVINVDISPNPEVHVHRIGRTGRAGETGLAISLASLDEMGAVGLIEKFQGITSIWHALDELTPTSKEPLQAPMVTLQILGGRKEKIRAGDVLGALTADAGFEREQIGKINVTEFTTFVAVERDIALSAMARLNAGKVKGRRVKVRLV